MLGIVTRTQIIGIAITMRINHGEHLPKHFGCSSLEYDLTTSPALFLTTLKGGENKGGKHKGEGKKEKIKAQRLNINAIKPNHRYTG